MRVEDLERELRAERPTPDPEFARRLDEWAASGFPRDRGLGPRSGSATAGGWRGIRDRLAATPPRRLLLPAGAIATVVVVAGVAISQSNEIARGPDQTAGIQEQSPARNSQGSGTKGNATGGSAGGGVARTPSGGAASGPSASDEYDLNLPDATSSSPSTATPLRDLAPQAGGAGIARGTDQRIVDATATLTLGADADQVQDVVNDVIAVTDRYRGIVLTSQTNSDQSGARASLELQIPYKQLGAALDQLSGLADVVSRSEGSKDITAGAVHARKHLADLLDQIRNARIELIRADTREQRLVIRAQIASLQASADAAQTQLNAVKRRGRFATVNVDVTSSGAAASGGDGDGWGLGSALDDAGRVLEVIGGVALISLAVLVPLALVAALAWLAVSTARHHQRERALGPDQSS